MEQQLSRFAIVTIESLKVEICVKDELIHTLHEQVKKQKELSTAICSSMRDKNNLLNAMSLGVQTADLAIDDLTAQNLAKEKEIQRLKDLSAKQQETEPM